MVVVSGLAQHQADALDDGANGDHTRGTSSWLTGVHPKRTEGADVRNGISADQIAAAVARQGHGAAVARAGHRPQLPRRPVREQLQLRLPEHAGVADADRRRCRPRTTRASCSSGCSATAARRQQRLAQARREPQHPRLGHRRSVAAAAVARARRSHDGRPTTSTRCAKSSGAFRASRRVGAVGAADARAAGRHPRAVRRARQADVRPAVAGVPRRHHARRDVHARPRAELPHLSRRSASPKGTTGCRITRTIRRRSRSTRS